MGVNQHTKYVALYRSPQTGSDTSGFFEALSPPNAWCAIMPSIGSVDQRTTEHLVEMRYHPQVSVDTCLSYVDPVLLRTRQLFVRGVQNIDEANDVMRLTCEELAP